MLLIKNTFLEEILQMERCIQLMEQALRIRTQGLAYEPLRTILSPPSSSGRMFVMPSFKEKEETPACFGLKCLCVFEENTKIELSSRQGTMLLFCGETGQLLAMMNAEPITHFRTAAVSGVATKTLAAQEADTLVIIGTGLQAQYHIKAMKAVRNIREAYVVGRTLERAERMANTVKSSYDFPIYATSNAKHAVEKADIIVTATSSLTPVLNFEWLKSNVHINAIGSVKPHAQELDCEVVKRAKLFVDSKESVKKETGDYLIPLAKGMISNDHPITEIGELLQSPRLFKRSTNDVTVFKSVGLPIEDLVIAEYIYKEALRLGIGTKMSF